MTASTVSKKYFADALAKQHHLTKKQGREMLEDLIGMITKHLKKGERVKIPPPATIADGMRTQTPGALTFPILRQNAEDVLTVSEDEIVEAMRLILFRLKMLVEPTGAVAAAAALFNKLPKGIERVGVVLSGGNVDPELFAKLVA